jgi:hypothetical protein
MILALPFFFTSLLLPVKGGAGLPDASLFLKQMADSVYSTHNSSAIELGMVDGEWSGPVSFIDGPGGMHNLTKYSFDRYVVIDNELMKLAIKDDASTFKISLKSLTRNKEVLWTGSPVCSITQEGKQIEEKRERRSSRWKRVGNGRYLRDEREDRELRSVGKLFKFEKASGEDSLYQWGMIAWDLKNDKFLCRDEGFFDLEGLRSDKGISSAWEVENAERRRKFENVARVREMLKQRRLKERSVGCEDLSLKCSTG